MACRGQVLDLEVFCWSSSGARGRLRVSGVVGGWCSRYLWCCVAAVRCVLEFWPAPCASCDDVRCLGIDLSLWSGCMQRAQGLGRGSVHPLACHDRTGSEPCRLLDDVGAALCGPWTLDVGSDWMYRCHRQMQVHWRHQVL